MNQLHKKDADMLLEAMLSLNSVDEFRNFFEDICTVKELQAMVQRFQVACQLYSGRNYNQVSADTGASSATICRVNKCLLYGKGGYRTALKRLKETGVIPYEDGDSNIQA